MNISESLARGLKERFFNELKDGAIGSIATMLGNLNSSSNRKKFNKWADHAESALGANVINSYHGGSNRNQYFAFEILNFIPNREFNSWMEKSVFGQKVIIHEALQGNNVVSSKYGISEHAILRIFQRINNDGYTNGYSQRKILNEISFVPLWANFWFLMLSQITNQSLPKKFSISIPAINGLFLANYDSETQNIEIRTFLDDSILSEEQWLIKKSMHLISRHLNPSSLSFACIKTTCIDQSITHLFCMLSHLIYNNENFNFLINDCIAKIEDEVCRASIKNEITLMIKNFANIMTFKEVNYLISHSPREFSNYCIKNFKLT
jgi:hypothetical protein